MEWELKELNRRGEGKEEVKVEKKPARERKKGWGR